MFWVQILVKLYINQNINPGDTVYNIGSTIYNMSDTEYKWNYIWVTLYKSVYKPCWHNIISVPLYIDLYIDPSDTVYYIHVLSISLPIYLYGKKLLLGVYLFVGEIVCKYIYIYIYIYIYERYRIL